MNYKQIDCCRINNQDIHYKIAQNLRRKYVNYYDQDVIDENKELHAQLNLPENVIYGPSIIDYDGIWFISTYPIEFIEQENELKIGIYHCLFCSYDACYNGVCIGICSICASNPLLQETRGSGFSYSGVELNPFHINSACNTYLKFIRFDLIGCRHIEDTENELQIVSKQRDILQKACQHVAFSNYDQAHELYKSMDNEEYLDVISETEEEEEEEEIVEKEWNVYNTIQYPYFILYYILLQYIYSLFNSSTIEEYDVDEIVNQEFENTCLHPDLPPLEDIPGLNLEEEFEN